MSSPQHKYDNSDSEGDDFNPAPADMSDDEPQRDEPESPVASRNDARRSSVSRDDEDADADADANADGHSANGHDEETGTVEEEEEEAAGGRKVADDDDEEDDEEDDEDEEDDDEEMPVRAIAPSRCARYRFSSPQPGAGGWPAITIMLATATATPR
jgi:transcription elongation factor SPT5